MRLWMYRIALNYALWSPHRIVVLHYSVLPESFLLALPSVNAENFQAFITSTCNKRWQAKTFACVLKSVFWSMFFEGKYCWLVLVKAKWKILYVLANKYIFYSIFSSVS